MLIVLIIALIFINNNFNKFKTKGIEPIGLPISIGYPDETEPIGLPSQSSIGTPDKTILQEGYILYQDCKNNKGGLTQINTQDQNCPSGKINLGRIYDVDCLCICCK